MLIPTALNKIAADVQRSRALRRMVKMSPLYDWMRQCERQRDEMQGFVFGRLAAPVSWQEGDVRSSPYLAFNLAANPQIGRAHV